MMKKLLTLPCLLLFAAVPKAQIQGPLNGTGFTVIAIPGAAQTWVNPSNVAASDNSYSSPGNLPNPAGTYTDYLVVTGFGFSIPPGATISGIVAEVERSDPNGRTADYSIRIVKNGVIGTAEHASGATYSFSDNAQSFGNAGDLWGESWTAADINSGTFGIAIAAQRAVSGGTTGGRIDNIRIAVFYDFITLPVDLLLFKGTRKNAIVQLSWVTANEENMNYYEVERSTDGASYSAISRVNSQNRMFTTAYSINDEKPLSGKAWYRLKMLEKTGAIKYSNIIAIAEGSAAIATGPALYPNPLPRNGILQTVNAANEQLTVHFYTANGNPLTTVTTSSSVIILDDRGKNNNDVLFYRIIDKNGMVKTSGKLMLMN